MVQDSDKVFRSFDAYEISLGELLRGERATLGKTREQVQKDLKIKAEFIEAIEKCDLTGLDNRSFLAGYVRTYARYLGLDPEQVYKRFCHESGFLSSELNPFYSDSKKNYKKKIEPFPKFRSIWANAVSSAFSLSIIHLSEKSISCVIHIFLISYLCFGSNISKSKLEINSKPFMFTLCSYLD